MPDADEKKVKELETEAGRLESKFREYSVHYRMTINQRITKSGSLSQKHRQAMPS